MSTAVKHCDEYIMDFNAPMALRWFLFVNRLPAVDRMLCEQNGVIPKLFATYMGKRVRVVMASRMGDVGITPDLSANCGYKWRVPVSDLADLCNDSRLLPDTKTLGARARESEGR